MPKNLLVADDSITIRKVIGMVLATHDIQITSVDNGLDAISKAKELRPDLVLADVLMPGKSGYEVCEALKADPDTQQIPVLLLAGTFEPFDESRAQSARADAHITKPFESQALIDKVRSLLGMPPADGTPKSWVTKPSAPAPIAQAAPPAAPAPAQIARPAPAAAPPQPAAPQPPVQRPVAVPQAHPAFPRPPGPGFPQPPRPGVPQGLPRPPGPGFPPARMPAPMPPRPQPGAMANPGMPPQPGMMPNPGMPPPGRMPNPGLGNPGMPPPGMARPGPMPPGVPAGMRPMPMPGMRPPGPAPFPRPPGGAPLPVPGPGRGRDPFGLGAPGGPVPRDPRQAPMPQGRAPGMPPRQAQMPPGPRQNPEAMLREALSLASKETIEKVVWEVVPQLAETIIREELDRLIKEREGKS